MIKTLIGSSSNFYKANLHCHTTLSDGVLSPEEVKKLYMEHGYSIVAFTDHDLYITHSELKDEGFLPLNGFEVEINESEKPSWDQTKTCHLCFVSLDEGNDIHPLWHRSNYLFGNAPKNMHLVKFDESKPDYIRSHTPECVNDMIKIGRESGFFVTYNHPSWSLENYHDYSGYKGMNAFEIYNHGCFVAGYNSYAPHVYDDLLTDGKRIYGIYADDNHNRGAGTPFYDACGGYVMINAPTLEYKAVADALVNGSFYSSRGPEIYEMTFDTDSATVSLRCSDAETVILTTGSRHREKHYSANNGGKPLNEVKLSIHPADDIYFRITVIDKDGMTADTNAYFVDELIMIKRG